MIDSLFPGRRIELRHLLEEDRQRLVSVPLSINVAPPELGEVSLDNGKRSVFEFGAQNDVCSTAH